MLNFYYHFTIYYKSLVLYCFFMGDCSSVSYDILVPSLLPSLPPPCMIRASISL